MKCRMRTNSLNLLIRFETGYTGLRCVFQGLQQVIFPGALSVNNRRPDTVLAGLKKTLICRLYPPNLDFADIHWAIVSSPETICFQPIASQVIHAHGQRRLATVGENFNEIFIDKDPQFYILSFRKACHRERGLGLTNTHGAGLGPDEYWQPFISLTRKQLEPKTFALRFSPIDGDAQLK